MRDAILSALRMTEGRTKLLLEGDEVLYAACMFRILVTAEAANDLPATLREQFPDVDWRGLINMGNLLKHQYFRIESDVVWDTIRADFPILHSAVERMIRVEQGALADAAE